MEARALHSIGAMVAPASDRSAKPSPLTGPPLLALVHAYTRLLTGTIVVRTEAGQAHAIQFLDGAPTKVRTAEPVATLDTILLRQRIVHPQILANAVATACMDPNVLLGELLISQGLIERAQLDDALRWQTLEKLTYIMQCSDGATHKIYPGENLLAGFGGTELHPVDPLYCLMVAARLCASNGMVQRYVARLGDMQIGLRPGTDTARFGLTADEHHAVALLDESALTPAELAASGVPRHAAHAVLFTLGVTRMLTRIGGQTAPPPVSVDSPRPSDVRIRAPMPESDPGWCEGQADECVPAATVPAQHSVPMTSSSWPSMASVAPVPSSWPSLPSVMAPAPSSAPPASASAPSGDLEGMTVDAAFGEAERSLRYLAYDRAEAAAAHALSLAPRRPDIRALHAFIQAERRGPPPTWDRDHQSHYDHELATLSIVIAAAPNCEPAYYYRARLLQRLKRDRAAHRDFELASILNPGNVDATREVRRYQERVRALQARDAPERQGNGLLRWLGKKD